MKLASYSTPAVDECVGVILDGAVHRIERVDSMRSLVDLGLPTALELGRAALSTPGLPLESVTLLPTIQPASMRDCVAFEEHVAGVRRSIDGVAGVAEAWYDAPTFYFTNPHTIVATESVVPFPAASRERDFELEVAAIVGTRGSSLSAAEGQRAIFGYTILNDWSARDLQRREMQVSLGPAKGKDFASTLGPWLVTSDELDEHRDAGGFLDLWCTVSVNGTEVGRDLLSNMGWTFGALVAYASRDSLVVPGDVIGSGTAGNGGCLAELWGVRGGQDPRPLRDGDLVEVSVEGIGRIANRIGSAPPAPELPQVRRRSAIDARASAS
jgi:2-keto-4-pentenoate hydratase/2-oxohepta-3-ene-1,7-dioic acid hydratase in catechol pathway